MLEETVWNAANVDCAWVVLVVGGLSSEERLLGLFFVWQRRQLANVNSLLVVILWVVLVFVALETGEECGSLVVNLVVFLLFCLGVA